MRARTRLFSARTQWRARVASWRPSSLHWQVATKLVGLLAVRKVDAEPRSDEARRRLCFFANSLFMEVPPAPAVPAMRSFSVMTPFYSEDVIYTKVCAFFDTHVLAKRTLAHAASCTFEPTHAPALCPLTRTPGRLFLRLRLQADLEHENSDGVTVLLYLQTLYKLDWANFLERLGIRDLKLIWSPKYLMETRLWASLRAQTLSRTVLGMMHYEAALRLQAQLERWGSTNQTTLRKKHAKKKKHTHTHTWTLYNLYN
jgi:callose synthase